MRKELSKEKAKQIADETFKIFTERVVSFQDELKEAKEIYKVN